MSLISVTDHASTLFHAWLGGRSKHFPGALAYINAEIEADMAWEPDRQHAGRRVGSRTNSLPDGQCLLMPVGPGRTRVRTRSITGSTRTGLVGR